MGQVMMRVKFLLYCSIFESFCAFGIKVVCLQLILYQLHARENIPAGVAAAPAGREKGLVSGLRFKEIGEGTTNLKFYISGTVRTCNVENCIHMNVLYWFRQRSVLLSVHWLSCCPS